MFRKSSCPSPTTRIHYRSSVLEAVILLCRPVVVLPQRRYITVVLEPGRHGRGNSLCDLCPKRAVGKLRLGVLRCLVSIPASAGLGRHARSNCPELPTCVCGRVKRVQCKRCYQARQDSSRSNQRDLRISEIGVNSRKEQNRKWFTNRSLHIACMACNTPESYRSDSCS